MADDRPRILLDCDPGHDDVVAIVTAARSAELVGITTVAGNAPLDRTTYNAQVVRDMFGLDVPLHAGAPRPLVAEPAFAGFVHGESGLDGADLPAPTRAVDGDDAVAFIVDTCRDQPGLWLVPTGPLTNIALALRVAPDIVDHVAGISLMGGGSFGNRTPVSEFNIWADPEAAQIVYRCGAPITMAGLDVTHRFLIDERRIDDVAAVGGRFATVLADLFRFFCANYVSRHDHMPGAALHDPLAVLAVTHPDLFTVERRFVDVEVRGDITRGMTVIDRRDITDRPPANCDVLVDVDTDAAWSIVLDAIASVAAP